MSKTIRIDAEVHELLQSLADDFECTIRDAVRIVVDGAGHPHGPHAEPVYHLECRRCWPRDDERAAAEDVGMDAEERWYALHDGWVS